MDRSGSMESIANDVIGGFKTFIDEQKKQPGECSVSLYQFDSVYEPVFEGVDIQKVEDIKLVPRGSTALFDAIGRTINATGSRLDLIVEDEKPDMIIIITMTDGFENSSREFQKSKVKEMIEHQTSKYNWKFLFIGANQDAVLAGADLGISAASSLSFDAGDLGTKNLFDTLSKGVSSYRSVSKSYSFTEEDRQKAMEKK